MLLGGIVNLLDIRTVILVEIIVMATLSGAMLLYRKHRKTYPGFGLWSAAMLVTVAGYIALGLRGAIPVWLSIVVSNFLFQYSVVMRFGALMLFFRERSISRWWYVSAPMGMALIAPFYFVVDRIDIRVSILTAYLVFFALLNSYIQIKNSPPQDRPIRYLMGISGILFSIQMIVRAIAYFVVEDKSVFSTNLVISGNYVITLVFEVVWGIGFLMLNSQRIERQLLETQEQLKKNLADLQFAFGEIKTLSGLLPICAWCKKIRDDKGYWNQIEEYLKEHTTANFTHGLCPDCAENVFGPENDRKQ
jgi:hypothetical protein